MWTTRTTSSVVVVSNGFGYNIYYKRKHSFTCFFFLFFLPRAKWSNRTFSCLGSRTRAVVFKKLRRVPKLTLLYSFVSTCKNCRTHGCSQKTQPPRPLVNSAEQRDSVGDVTAGTDSACRLCTSSSSSSSACFHRDCPPAHTQTGSLHRDWSLRSGGAARTTSARERAYYFPPLRFPSLPWPARRE